MHGGGDAGPAPAETDVAKRERRCCSDHRRAAEQGAAGAVGVGKDDHAAHERHVVPHKRAGVFREIADDQDLIRRGRQAGGGRERFKAAVVAAAVAVLVRNVKHARPQDEPGAAPGDARVCVSVARGDVAERAQRDAQRAHQAHDEKRREGDRFLHGVMRFDIPPSYVVLIWFYVFLDKN